jgi:hypothetical protein
MLRKMEKGGNIKSDALLENIFITVAALGDCKFYLPGCKTLHVYRAIKTVPFKKLISYIQKSNHTKEP